VFVDVVGPFRDYDPVGRNEFPVGHYNYVLTLVCGLTDFTVYLPLTDKSAVTVTNAFERGYLWRYGVMDTVMCDNGEFRSKLLSSLCRRLGIVIKYTAAEAPWTNRAEIKNKVLGNMLSKDRAAFIEREEQFIFADHLVRYASLHNTQLSGTTIDMTPFALFFSWVPDMPIVGYYKYLEMPDMQKHSIDQNREARMQSWEKLLSARRELIRENQRRRNKTVNKKTTHHLYEIGDLVLREVPARSRRKTDARWRGPYRVVEIQNDKRLGVVPVRTTTKRHLMEKQEKLTYVSVRNIKPYIGRSTIENNEGDTFKEMDEDEDQVWEIESITAHKVEEDKITGEHKCYLKIRWKGFTEEDDTWEELSEVVKGAQETVANYMLNLQERPSVNFVSRRSEKGVM